MVQGGDAESAGDHIHCLAPLDAQTRRRGRAGQELLQTTFNTFANARFELSAAPDVSIGVCRTLRCGNGGRCSCVGAEAAY